MSIITYNDVQTEPKIHPGGFQSGLARPAYQLPGVDETTASGTQKVVRIAAARASVLCNFEYIRIITIYQRSQHRA